MDAWGEEVLGKEAWGEVVLEKEGLGEVVLEKEGLGEVVLQTLRWGEEVLEEERPPYQDLLEPIILGVAKITEMVTESPRGSCGLGRPRPTSYWPIQLLAGVSLYTA